MRNCMIGCVVLVVMAGTALGETNEPPLAIAPFDAAKAKGHQEAWAKHIGQPREVTNSIGMKLTLIPPGEFMMGNAESPEAFAAFLEKTFGEEEARDDSVYPQHRVRITKPFYLGTYHVTRGQFRQFVEDSGYKTNAENAKTGEGWDLDKMRWQVDSKYSWRNTGFEQTDEHPVVNVSWNDAVAFCKWLSKKDGRTYRLPTEAEWEYACRAGTTTRYYSGDDPETLAKVANVADASLRANPNAGGISIKASDGYMFTSPVGKFRPNAFGLYDMHGNVWQWCADWFAEDYYAASPADDPMGPGSGKYRICRGGSWCDWPSEAGSATRVANLPTAHGDRFGFRIAMTP